MPGLARIPKKLADSYELTFLAKGEKGFYKHILGITHINSDELKELALLDQSEAFFAMARSTGNDNYFTIGTILRRAAHRLYRVYNKGGQNSRFLRMIKH